MIPSAGNIIDRRMQARSPAAGNLSVGDKLSTDRTTAMAASALQEGHEPFKNRFGRFLRQEMAAWDRPPTAGTTPHADQVVKASPTSRPSR